MRLQEHVCSLSPKVILNDVPPNNTFPPIVRSRHGAVLEFVVFSASSAWGFVKCEDDFVLEDLR